MEAVESGPVQYSEFELVFSEDHDLSKLQALWKGDSRLCFPIHLSLVSDVPKGVSLPIHDPTRELQRLQILMNHTSHMRSREILSQCSQGTSIQMEEGVVLLLSSDKMVAWLFLFPPVGDGKELNVVQLCQILAGHDVKYGINWELLRQIPKRPERYFHLFPVAWGKEPIPGKDGYVVDRYERSYDGDVQIDELGHADYETLKLVQDIQEGDIICDIFPPTDGVKGCTVTGENVPAPMGQPAVVPQGRNTHVSEDGRFLVADRVGHVCFSGRSFQVKPVLHILQEELRPMQCIKFLGDVHIHGDLSEGISIYALGDIQVDGVVEDCFIEAGENIVVSSGVQGQNQAVLRAQKSVYAKYLENCRVYAQEHVFADCIINSDIYSNGTIQVLTGRGVLIGGTVRAATEIYAATVGSKAERPTHVFLGGRPCEEAQRMQVSEELEHITHTLTELEHQPADPTRDARLSKLRLNQCVAKMKLEKLDKEMETQMKASLNQKKNHTRIFCNIVYPGTIVTIGHEPFRVTQVKEKCAIGLINGTTGYL